VGTLALICGSNEERNAWVDAIFEGILRTNPEAATKPGEMMLMMLLVSLRALLFFLSPWNILGDGDIHI
jgi:hypothetical protein